jgi:predicted nuclease of predicted toxin-antitoxin system
MRCLIDNNVPRSVTLLLRDAGHEAVEVRAVLGPQAEDSAVAAYAAARQLVLVTHDRGLARRAKDSGLKHIWLRTPEPDDRDAMQSVLKEIESGLSGGAVRVAISTRAGATIVKVDQSWMDD